MPLRNLIKVIWILGCICVLGWWLYSFGMNSDLSQILKSESQVYLLIAMVILSFPISIVWVYIFAGLLDLLVFVGVNLSGPLQVDVIVLWFGFVTVGYLQWFMLLPYLLGKWRAWRDKQDMRMVSH